MWQQPERGVWPCARSAGGLRPCIEFATAAAALAQGPDPVARGCAPARRRPARARSRQRAGGLRLPAGPHLRAGAHAHAPRLSRLCRRRRPPRPRCTSGGFMPAGTARPISRCEGSWPYEAARQRHGGVRVRRRRRAPGARQSCVPGIARGLPAGLMHRTEAEGCLGCAGAAAVPGGAARLGRGAAGRGRGRARRVGR
jgi:hypothetical protein